VLVDGNGETEPLLERVEASEINITHLLATHHHADHVVDLRETAQRFGVPVVAHPLAAELLGDLVDETIDDGDRIHSGELEVEALHTPGHCANHLALLVNGSDCVTADVLFRGTVGGTRAPGATGFGDLKASVTRLLQLPPATRIHPGHSEPSTVGEERESNAFARIWLGLDSEGSEPCRVREQEATLVLWAPDYDGGHKAWVRSPSGEDAIVGGSQIARG